MARESNWRSIVIQADPEWPRDSQIVPEYPFSGPGPKDPKGYRANTIDGPNTFTGKTEARGPYSADWFTAAEFTPLGESDGWNDRSWAMRIEANSITNSTAATMMRLTFTAASGGSGRVDEVWVGAAVSTTSFDLSSSPTPVTVRGQRSFWIGNDESLVSDNVEFVLPSGSGLMLRAYFPDAEGIGSIAHSTSADAGFRYGFLDGSNVAGDVTVSGFTTSGNEASFVTKVEILE